MKSDKSCQHKSCKTKIKKGTRCHRHRHTTLISRYSHLKRAAKIKGLKVSLTIQDLEKLTSISYCTYCGGGLSDTGHNLDRLDSSKGYVKGNVVPCCSGCNSLKSNILSPVETRKVVDLLKKMRDTVNLWVDSHNKKKGRKNGIRKSR